MSKAKAKHDPERPESPAVRKALEAMDMEALSIALTTRQRQFCNEYILDFNGAAAAVRAGYSTNYPDRQAHQLLRNKGVAAYIEHMTTSRAAKVMSVDPDWVMQGVVAVINDAEKSGDKLRGYELIAKILGMLTDKHEITGKDGEAIQIEQRRVDEEADSFIRSLHAMRRKNEKKEVTIV
jgi:hypothetical protein